MRKLIGIALCLPLLALIACASVISQQSLSRVDPAVNPEELQKSPEKYTGKVVLLGGMILKTAVRTDETLLEILRQPLDGSYRPVGVDRSYGRFIVRFKGFMDPVIYAVGRKITLVGEVAGKETRPLDGIQYTYPVITPGEYHLWREETEYGTGVSIGVGAGAVFR